MQKKRHSFEFMREWTHLRQRSRLFHAVTAIRHELTMFTHDFFAVRRLFRNEIITNASVINSGRMDLPTSTRPS